MDKKISNFKTKNEIIDYLFSNKMVEKYGWKQLKYYKKKPDKYDEIVAEVYANICEIPDEKFSEIIEQGEKHITAYIRQFVIWQLSENGQTRNLKKIWEKELPTDFNVYIEKENTDEHPTEKRKINNYIDNDIDTKLKNELEKYE